MSGDTPKKRKQGKKNATKCPRCENGVLNNRVKRSLAVKLFLFWMPVKRYKCNTCGKKVYVYGKPKSSDKNLAAV